jgi:hypothetical protein
MKGFLFVASRFRRQMKAFLTLYVCEGSPKNFITKRTVWIQKGFWYYCRVALIWKALLSFLRLDFHMNGLQENVTYADPENRF